MQKATTEVTYEIQWCTYSRVNSSASHGDAHFGACIWILCTEMGMGIALRSNLGLALAAANACAKHWSNCRGSIKANGSLCSTVPSWTSAHYNEHHILLKRRDLQVWSSLGRPRVYSTIPHYTTLGIHLVQLAITWKTAYRACIRVQVPSIMAVVHRENKEIN